LNKLSHAIWGGYVEDSLERISVGEFADFQAKPSVFRMRAGKRCPKGVTHRRLRDDVMPLLGTKPSSGLPSVVLPSHRGLNSFPTIESHDRANRCRNKAAAVIEMPLSSHAQGLGKRRSGTDIVHPLHQDIAVQDKSGSRLMLAMTPSLSESRMVGRRDVSMLFDTRGVIALVVRVAAFSYHPRWFATA